MGSLLLAAKKRITTPFISYRFKQEDTTPGQI